MEFYKKIMKRQMGFDKIKGEAINSTETIRLRKMFNFAEK